MARWTTCHSMNNQSAFPVPEHLVLQTMPGVPVILVVRGLGDCAN